VKHVLYFTAEWCNPCARTKPFAEELIKDGHSIKFIDADTEAELVKSFEIKSIPTFILIEDAIEIKRMKLLKHIMRTGNSL
jgi:thiol-disulfide isomerase/thioredoxin